MEQQLWSNDDDLLAALGDALRSAGPVPRSVTLSGRAAWTWRNIDAELATLVFDSDLEGAVSVRGEELTGARLLIFEGGQGSSVEFEVGEDGLVGQLLPPVTGEVSLLSAAGDAVETATDELGCFVLPLPVGAFRLVCRSPESTFTTDWVRL
ncbi:MAG: hypothetical protein QOF35_1138 [Actinomycetota bacterium]|nr:hypothetical protein [Actinomycetota bacterium]